MALLSKYGLYGGSEKVLQKLDTDSARKALASRRPFRYNPAIDKSEGAHGMERYQAVIVGGGPAGSALGYLLRKEGISACVIERSVFPREKLCGGMLTEKTADLLEEIYGTRDFPCRNVTSDVEIFMGTTRISYASVKPRLYLVERREFDNELIERYKAAGGALREGVRVRDVDTRRRRLTLTDGTEIGYRVLIGADGANSRTRKLVDPDYRANAFCAEATSPTPEASNPVRIYFGGMPGGYGWRFPKGGYDAVGIGGEIVKGYDMKAALIKFAEDAGAPVEPSKIRGAMISDGHYVRRPYKGSVLLIGDAAGLIDPVTGEGIYFALRSASYAASAIAALLRDGVSLADTYGADIRKIHAIMDSGNRCRRVFYNKLVQPLLLRVRPGNKERHPVTEWALENILADYHYTYGQFFLVYPFIRLRQKLERRRDK